MTGQARQRSPMFWHPRIYWGVQEHFTDTNQSTIIKSSSDGNEMIPFI